MFRTIANTIMGERACTAKELFSTGLSDNETDAGRDVFFGENILNFLYNEFTTKEAYRESVPDAGKPTQRALQRFFWSSRSTSRASVI